MRMAHFRWSILLLSLLISCSVTEDLDRVDQEILKIHQAIDAGQLVVLYERSDDGLKKGASKSEFIDYLSAVHRKLGIVKESKRITWNVTHNTSGYFVTTQYETEFAEGKGMENFVFHFSGNQPLLYSYSNGSTMLVTK